MPPKVKFTSNEIIEVAVKITRAKGIDAVTAREVGRVLGVSSRPLFTYFDTVDELKREVYLYAKNLYKEYVENGLKAEIPFLGVGQQYIRFVKDEPNLYKYLFLTPPDGVYGGVMEALKLSQDLARESLMRIYNMDADTADKYFRDLWLVAYGFTTMVAIGECPYNDEEICAIFTEFSLSICKAYKEIPGFSCGKFDRDAIFKELVRKGKENNDIKD